MKPPLRDSARDSPLGGAEASGSIERPRLINDVERAMLVRRLSASFAHVLANSLNVIGMRASMLALARDPEAVERSASEISEHVGRISSLFERMQHYAEAIEPEAELVDLASEAEMAISKLEMADKHGQNVEIRYAKPCAIVLPRAVVAVVLGNLIEFTLRAMPPGGSSLFELSIERVKRGTGELEVAKIRVALPPGVDLPTDRRALVDPWLSTDADPQRDRILLALGIGAVRDRGGWFETEGEPNPVITVFWPARASHAT